MNFRIQYQSGIAIGFSFFLASVGCQRNAAVPAKPATEATSSSASPATKTADTESDNHALNNSEANESPFELEPGYQLLGIDDFEAYGSEADTWTATGDILVCSGKPRGYLYSKKPFQNFSWRVEYRFPRPTALKDEVKFKGNTGFLVYITGEHKLWPMCIEVQGKHVQIAAIKENGGAQPVVAEDDEAVRKSIRKPVGQWNAIEIISRDGALQALLNGTPICKSQPDFLSEGGIGIQSEDHPFEVRRMRIKVE